MYICLLFIGYPNRVSAIRLKTMPGTQICEHVSIVGDAELGNLCPQVIFMLASMIMMNKLEQTKPNKNPCTSCSTQLLTPWNCQLSQISSQFVDVLSRLRWMCIVNLGGSLFTQHGATGAKAPAAPGRCRSRSAAGCWVVAQGGRSPGLRGDHKPWPVSATDYNSG